MSSNFIIGLFCPELLSTQPSWLSSAFHPSVYFPLYSLLILSLVQSHYWHFCQSSTLNAVSIANNQQLPLGFLPPPLFHSRQWLAQTDNVQLSLSPPHTPPPPSLDSASTNICCVQSGFGQSGEGVDAEVKPISMQIVMTSCPPPPLPHLLLLLLLSLCRAPMRLVGRMSEL